MAALLIEYGQRRQSVPIDGQMTIGRAMTNRIVVPDDAVSERHAIVGRSKDRMVIKVLDKRHGVVINGEPCFHSRVLQPGDWFQIGKARMLLQLNSSMHARITDGGNHETNGHATPAFVSPTGSNALPSVQHLQPPTVAQKCGVCHCAIGATDEIALCPECRLPFHNDCWIENRGCAAYGCGQVSALQPNPDIRISTAEISGGEYSNGTLGLSPKPSPLAAGNAATPKQSGNSTQHIGAGVGLIVLAILLPLVGNVKPVIPLVLIGFGFGKMLYGLYLFIREPDH